MVPPSRNTVAAFSRGGSEDCPGWIRHESKRPAFADPIAGRQALARQGAARFDHRLPAVALAKAGAEVRICVICVICGPNGLGVSLSDDERRNARLNSRGEGTPAPSKAGYIFG